MHILLVGYAPFQRGDTDAGGEDEQRAVLRRSVRGDFNLDDMEWTHVSSEAKDLVKKMLVVEDAKRISTEDALRHPWIVRQQEQLMMANARSSSSLTAGLGLNSSNSATGGARQWPRSLSGSRQQQQQRQGKGRGHRKEGDMDGSSPSLRSLLEQVVFRGSSFISSLTFPKGGSGSGTDTASSTSSSASSRGDLIHVTHAVASPPCSGSSLSSSS